ncbi:M3 family metallopeptidase [soil metagenome]
MTHVETPDEFRARCLLSLTRAKELRPQVVSATPRTIASSADAGRAAVPQAVRSPEDSTLTTYNDMLRAASGCNALAGLYSEVHPDEKVRDVARECEQEVSRFYSELWLDREVYDALAAVDVSSSDADTVRFHEHVLRDYRRAGVDKDAAIRGRLREIDDELTKLGQQFGKAIAEDVRTLEVTKATRLGGLPADFLAAHPPDAEGVIRITTDTPDYTPFMTYAVDDELRKKLYIAFRSRGDVANETVLQNVLALRSEKAMLLGFANWADYITADKMIGSADKAAAFLERVSSLCAPRAEQDFAELLKQAKQIDASATTVKDWQKSYLENLVKLAQYDVDSSEVRQYFPFASVLAGLLDITQEVFGIRYKPVSDARTWHAAIRVFDVSQGQTKLGRIYLDMHPREGKYKHAAQFPLVDGVRGVQLPEGVLVCNFAEPDGDDPGLLEHDDVVTMFHEFGHLMHHVLGGHQRWITQSGVATEWDFVEAPSQMFEEWAWSHETLARFAKHQKTGALIPEELVEKMRRADKFGLGLATVQQVFYASISLAFHRADPKTLDQLAIVKELQAKYTPFEYVPGTRFHASFGHLIGYSAMYYTYQWSLVIAKDLLTPFTEKGLMSPTVTHAYRDKVLVPGGSKDAAVLVRDFLGRDYDFTAYEQYLTT